MSNTEIELIVWNFVRIQYEKKHEMNVPVALKHLITLFTNKISMLTIEEDMEFFNLLSTKLPNIKSQEIKSIHRASEYEFTAKSFHNACDGHGPTLTIIKSKYGNIFGGYTSVPWSSDEELH